jgi:hypothetical protein
MVRFVIAGDEALIAADPGAGKSKNPRHCVDILAVKCVAITFVEGF